VRLIPKELPIARRGFGVLVDRQQDCPDVVITPAFMHPNLAGFGYRLRQSSSMVTALGDPGSTQPSRR
jgi:hypothetical protein